MDPAKRTVLMVGISIIIFYFIILFILFPFFNIPIGTHTLPPLLTYSFIFSGILIFSSGFLPYKLGKLLREATYMVLLLSILFFLIILSIPYIKKIDVPIERCLNEIFPERVNRVEGAGDLVAYATCILTGYYTPDNKNLAQSIFILFYVILPFTFIFSFLWGLFISGKVVNLPSMIGKGPARVITFIMALYASRVVFGVFLLELIGYGIWGFAMLFVSFILTSALKNLVESKFRLEEFASELSGFLEQKMKIEEIVKNFFEAELKIFVEKVEGATEETIQRIVNELDEIKGRLEAIAVGREIFMKNILEEFNRTKKKVELIAGTPGKPLNEKKEEIKKEIISLGKIVKARISNVKILHPS